MNIELINVQKCYGDKCVLEIEALNLDKQQIYGVVGENGAGKSTLLKLIAGLEAPSSGTIAYDGESMSSAVIKRITYVSQTPYLLKRSVFENVAYPLKIRNMSPERCTEKVKNMLAMLQIESLAKRNAQMLSAGETQKVALARALVFEPDVLLLDEPTANIDQDTIELIESVLRNRHGMMTLHISHNRDQVERLCDTVIKLSGGRLVQAAMKGT
ncbi:ATP-binding cassette domain-containing protein [Fusibacter paucivorans]|uniref:ATP-binding cassette domain-containing protein n=1 Tax=Fusibacter paucivorans TaxID=76009 RepID=A0ABS5PL92_9FIRM|nr:ATP-binding cassette domain-containing protein [Fusibacter paucivorans]MBS7525898.1 ATP-binding cassette domain-containing protein [Fusibacter paucivorans]